ncbi:sigma-70 family RNA polymerase sigma factor [uncultured Alsobacter sp.]|uniref:sigma-70 family RNA polymerase sigma factor n=1 Tax=uncultured Alsobacter sp. TaxID=1748258 RepID=UPI0025EF641B|nr:sigma-70 family RNA polymerase sigma factor [uncultured Alsobacter sp.]
MTADDPVASFEAQRPRLVRLACRMLGSRSDAEDVVQSAWIRWMGTDRGEVRSVPAFLARVVTRLCLDEMKSARARREIYVGAWLPEPVLDRAEEDIDGDDLTLTLMLALERLSPLERAAFLLHDVFGMPLDAVADTLGRKGPAVRQLAARARRHVREARPRFPVDRAEGERIAKAFFAATASGDLTALRGLLAENAELRSDGGGKVLAFPNPVRGIERLLRLYASLSRKWGSAWAEMIEPVWIDGLPGYISRERGAILQTTALAIECGRVVGIYVTRNPDKLQRVPRPASGAVDRDALAPIDDAVEGPGSGPQEHQAEAAARQRQAGRQWRT